ncbi:hypothetical protein BGY98DRAFT_977942 [Russula aff. rugulosa BPL654]|nr:hypothetical protein BGY98DRAFT_977942 [Russula aff. rugulosa BPL654]
MVKALNLYTVSPTKHSSPDRSIDLLSKLHPQAGCEANGTTIPFLYYKNIQSTSTDHEYHKPTDQFVPGDLYGVMLYADSQRSYGTPERYRTLWSWVDGLSLFRTSLLPIVLVSVKARGLPNSLTGRIHEISSGSLNFSDSNASATSTARFPVAAMRPLGGQLLYK